MAQTDGHGGLQIESAQCSGPIWFKYFIETTQIFGISYVLPVYNLNLLLSNTRNTKYIHNL